MATFVERVMSGLTAGITAFREAYMNAGALDSPDFNEFEARKLRYAIFWAFFQNTAYRDINKWAPSLRAEYGLYKFARNIYNPAYRLGKFWQAHLMGGALDPNAGDGKTAPSALPILTEVDALRTPIAALWRDSNWQIRKDIFTLQGSLFGDIGLRVIDDVERAKVYLDVVHPGTIKSVTLDPFGNVKGYTLEESRVNPNGNTPKFVTYTEVAARDGANVVYQTFLNGTLYAWNGIAAEWAEPYGFIPLVICQHNNVGLEWGWSELHPGLAKFREVDDLSAMLHDQIRKMVNAAWLLAGVSESKARTPNAKNNSATSENPGNGREEVPIFYGPVGAQPHALVAPLDIAAAGARVDALIVELERDYPELKIDELRVSGSLSGRAMALAQQPAEDKAYQLRAGYDNGLVRAQQMAIAIGGHRGYEGYAGFDLDSYAAGKLNHSIGARRVFAQTPLDELEERTAFYGVFKAASDAGAPIPRKMIWQEAGYEDVDAMEKDLQAQMEANMSAALQDVIVGASQ